ncbi:MAG: hypothetical protein JWQ16_1094 [Novosphingobium sp.]|nr:hypothetical protein [Novosphingobium sp.]
MAGQALTALGALSVGTFVLLLAVALPLFAFKDAAGTILRAVSAIIGAVQLALLVATGGYLPLHWGLFALIAAAGQWLAWRDGNYRIVPTLSAALSGLLLLLWPEPAGAWFAAIGLSLTAIHALPLLAKLWREPVRLQWAAELGAIAAALLLVGRPSHERLVEPVASAFGALALYALFGTITAAHVHERLPGSQGQ